MRNHVVIVPSDNIIIVDGQILNFEFEAPDDLHALQWHNGSGEIEVKGEANQQLTELDYAEKVKPFVKAWEKEKAKRDEEERKQEEEALLPERLAEALRRERDARIAATDYLMMPDYPISTEERTAWGQYRTFLRDITKLEGFPWKTPESVPWPLPPSL